jgi:hypothetical protein
LENPSAELVYRAWVVKPRVRAVHGSTRVRFV